MLMMESFEVCTPVQLFYITALGDRGARLRRESDQ